MKAISIFITISLVAIAGGCNTSTSPSITKPEIISSLESGSRTATHIALWTLRDNSLSVPKIDLEKPYLEARPKLKHLTEDLERLPESRLLELDKSLKHHWSIYSPIWSEGSHGWKQ